MACLLLCNVLLLTVVAGVSSVSVPTSTPRQGSSSDDAVVTGSSTRTSTKSVKCHFITADPEIRDKLKEKLTPYTQLVKFTIQIVKPSTNGTATEYCDEEFLKTNDTEKVLFRPHVWTRSANLQGQTLLLIDKNFEILSLTLLGLGIESMHVSLTDSPPGCLPTLSANEQVQALRTLLLNGLAVDEDNSASFGEDERICNQWMENADGEARIKYTCCHITPTGERICKELEKNLWSSVLLVSILVIKILVVLYSPGLIPDTFYRRKYTDMNYTYRVDGLKRLKVVKTMNPESYQSHNPPVRMSSLKDLVNFKKLVTCMHADEPHEITLSGIHLTVKSKELLSESYVPVSIVRMLNDNLLQCKIREMPVFTECCDTGILMGSDGVCKMVTWFKCVKVLAKLILMGILALPWIIRLVIYYQHEAELTSCISETADRIGAKVEFNGSFVHYLTPTHPLFITIYVCVLMVVLIYGFMNSTRKTEVRLTVRKCLRDMRERSRTDVYVWAIRWLLIPMKRVGIFGVLIIPVYWPLVLLFTLPFAAVSTFPALNLSLRLIIHPFSLICESCSMKRLSISEVKDTVKRKAIGKEQLFDIRDNLTKKDICIQSVIIIGCLISFWSLTFLVMECLSFFVELVMYTLIGIIVNASATLRYVSLFFLVFLYTKDSLRGVHELYLAYHTVIRNLLIADQKAAMLTVATKNDFEQENIAFRVQGDNNEDKTGDLSSGVDLKVENDVITWETSSLLVFLNNLDQPFTPRKFFFETIELDCAGVPGSLWRNTFMAFYSVSKMVVFLFFVAAVVLAFGNKISTTNQLLAILASGFLPFAFRNFLVKRSVASVNTGSVRFITLFQREISQYTQNWPAADIIEDECEKVIPKPTRSESVFDEVSNIDPESGSEPAEPKEEVIVEINRDINNTNNTMDLIVHISSAEKMKHLVHRCVSNNEQPLKATSVSSFSNPMFT